MSTFKSKFAALLFVAASLPSIAQAGPSTIYSWFAPGRMADSLEMISSTFYPFKANFLLEAAKITRDLPPVQSMAATAKGTTDPGTLDHLFVLNALGPLFETTTSSYCQGTILPRYTTAHDVFNERYGIRRIVDFRRDAVLMTVSLRLLHAAFSAMQPFATSDQDLCTLGTIQSSLGRSLASGSDPRQVLAEFASPSAAELLERLQANSRTQGLAIMSASLLEFLRD